MTIRYTCSQCSSVLKIKDDRAGTVAQCPKCKTKFMVPEVAVERESPVLQVAASRPEAAHSDDAVHSKSVESEQPVQGSTAASDLPESQTDSDHMKLDYDAEDSHTTLSAGSSAVNQNGDSASDTAHLTTGVGEESSEPGPAAAETPESSESEELATNQASDLGDEHRSFESDDDDDLDSPSMLAGPLGGFMPKTEETEQPVSVVAERKSTEAAKKSFESQLERRSRTPLEIPLSIDRPSPVAAKEEAFDPANFLLSDSSVPSSGNSSSTLQNDSDLSLSDDSDYEVLARPSPRPVNTSAGKKITTSRPTPEKVDLASAAKMMKKAIKDAQVDAVRQRQQNAKPPGVDYSFFLKEFGLKFGGGLLAILAVGYGIYFLSDQALGRKMNTPKLAIVRGTITLRGRPLPNATIYFEPIREEVKGKKLLPVRTSMGLSDEKGQFKMMYSANLEGVTVGKNKMWVVYIGENGLKDTPDEWRGARLVEIKEGRQEKPFDIHME